MTAQKLALVPPTAPSCEDILREAFAGREEAARTLRQFDTLIAAELRVLAKERGVAFVRVETARRELLG